MKYLGVLRGGIMVRIPFWDRIVLKVCKHLNGWKSYCLSWGGRLYTDLNFIVKHSIYYLSLFLLGWKTLF